MTDTEKGIAEEYASCGTYFAYLEIHVVVSVLVHCDERGWINTFFL